MFILVKQKVGGHHYFCKHIIRSNMREGEKLLKFKFTVLTKPARQICTGNYMVSVHWNSPDAAFQGLQ